MTREDVARITHFVNKGPFNWDDSQGSHRHCEQMTLYLERFARVTKTLCEQMTVYWDDSQGPYRHFVNKWPFIWDDSQMSHRHFMNKGPFT